MPFSDPIADGPVIQRGRRARAQGRHHARDACSKSPRRIRERSEVPLLLFTYLNPVLRYGLERLARDAAAAGIDGCLLTEPRVEEAHEYVAAMHRHGLDTVFLAAPTSTERRLKLVAQYSTGFVYLVSRTGVTGERDSLSDAVAPLVRAVRAVTDLPLAVGFGISKPGARGGAGPAGGSGGGGQRVRAADRAQRSTTPRSRSSSNLRPRAQARLRSAAHDPGRSARSKLEECRVLIDDVDRRIVALLNERTRVVEESAA